MRILLICLTALLATMLHGCGMNSEVKDDPIFQQGQDVYTAAMSGDLELTRQYIAWGGFDPQVANYQGILPLCAAAKGGNVDIIWLMINEGADVNEADQNGMTPLQYAKDAGNDDAVAYLKELGATE